VNATVASKAWIWCQKHRSGNTSWKVQIGKTNLGKPDIRTFTTETEATNFANDWNARLVGKNTNGLTDLSTLQRAEVLAALARLEAYNATLQEAVDFFLKFARPEKGKITVDEAVKLFLESKTKLKRSDAFLRGCKKTYYGPFAKHFTGRCVADITPTECERYIDSHDWNANSKSSHVSYLRGLYNWLIKKCYARLNPFTNIERPRASSTIPKVISPEDVTKLLQFALDTEHKAECACMALVFFAGIRAEGEVQRLNWENIDFDAHTVTLSAEQAKTGVRRTNDDIPPNAWEWLKLCKGKGRIAPKDHIQRMKRLRQRCKKAHLSFAYPQNCMRHCFCSYHIAEFKNADKTARMMSHPNAQLLYRTYYALVKAEDAHRFWRVVPASVKPAWEERAKQEAAQARLAAIKQQLQAQSQL
jgi:integrase